MTRVVTIAAVVMAAWASAVSAVVWMADSLSGEDNAGCGQQPQTQPCLTLAYAMTFVANNDVLQLQSSGPNGEDPVPFAIPHNVFIARSNVTVTGVQSPVTSSYPTLMCESQTALYITAMNSTVSNLWVANCTLTGIIYDFESFSTGHVISGVTFQSNYKAVGAEGCALTIQNSDFLNSTSNAVGMGSGELTIVGGTYIGNGAGGPLGALGSVISCAKCSNVSISEINVYRSGPSDPSAEALPAIWIGYSQSLTLVQSNFQNNFQSTNVVVVSTPTVDIESLSFRGANFGANSNPQQLASVFDLRTVTTLTLQLVSIADVVGGSVVFLQDVAYAMFSFNTFEVVSAVAADGAGAIVALAGTTALRWGSSSLDSTVSADSVVSFVPRTTHTTPGFYATAMLSDVMFKLGDGNGPTNAAVCADPSDANSAAPFRIQTAGSTPSIGSSTTKCCSACVLTDGSGARICNGSGTEC